MITLVECPKCGSSKVIKHGKTAAGKQRYFCKNSDCICKSFIIDFTYNSYKTNIDTDIIKLYDKKFGVRNIARTLGISTGKVMSTIKKIVREDA